MKVEFKIDEMLEINGIVRCMLFEFILKTSLELFTEGYKDFWFRIVNKDDIIVYILYKNNLDGDILSWQIYLQSKLVKMKNKWLKKDIDKEILLIIESHDLWK